MSFKAPYFHEIHSFPKKMEGLKGFLVIMNYDGDMLTIDEQGVYFQCSNGPKFLG